MVIDEKYFSVNLHRFLRDILEYLYGNHSLFSIKPFILLHKNTLISIRLFESSNFGIFAISNDFVPQFRLNYSLTRIIKAPSKRSSIFFITANGTTMVIARRNHAQSQHLNTLQLWSNKFAFASSSNKSV